jgi:NADH:ubiquinone oxidoreductase subunit E
VKGSVPTADLDADALQELISSSPTTADSLLPLLQRVQKRFGFVSPVAIRAVAQSLNLSRAEVYGVVSFYGDLRESPVGKHVVQLCMAEACQAVGCRALARHAVATLGAEMEHTTRDGRIHLEAAYCFGNCALGPTVRIGDQVYGAVSQARFDALMAPLRE